MSDYPIDLSMCFALDFRVPRHCEDEYFKATDSLCKNPGEKKKSMRSSLRHFTYSVGAAEIHCPWDSLRRPNIELGRTFIKPGYHIRSNRRSGCSDILNEHISDLTCLLGIWRTYELALHLIKCSLQSIFNNEAPLSRTELEACPGKPTRHMDHCEFISKPFCSPDKGSGKYTKGSCQKAMLLSTFQVREHAAHFLPPPEMDPLPDALQSHRPLT
jgi:hypothetical protein